MSASCFIMWNAATTALTSPMSGVASSTTAGTVKTLLQIAPVNKIRVVEWGYIFTTSPAAPVQMELVTTDVAATVTSASTTAVIPYNDVGGVTTVTSGTSATGYTATAEGSITATRLLAQNFDLATYFKQQFPLGREPEVAASKFLRIRVTPSSNAAVTCLVYAIWEE